MAEKERKTEDNIFGMVYSLEPTLYESNVAPYIPNPVPFVLCPAWNIFWIRTTNIPKSILNLKGPSQPSCIARVSSETGHFRCHRYSEIFTVVLRSHCIGASSRLSSEYLLLRVCWTIIEEMYRYIFLTVIIFNRFLRIGRLSNRRSILAMSWEADCWMNS